MDKRQLIKSAMLSVSSDEVQQIKGSKYPTKVKMAVECSVKQIETAVNSFAEGCRVEDVVVLVDMTVLDSGKKGWLFTEEGLYVDQSHLLDSPYGKSNVLMPLRYEELEKVTLDNRKTSYVILQYKDGRLIRTYVSIYAGFLYVALNRILKALEGQKEQEFIPEPVPVPKPISELSGEEMVKKGAACHRKKDFEGAVCWMEKALDSGELWGESMTTVQYMCGMLCNTENTSIFQPEKALEWFEKAAQGGHDKAQYYSGIMYAEGKGTKKDLNKAIEYLEMAAAQGYKQAEEEAKKVKAILSVPEHSKVSETSQIYSSLNQLYLQAMEFFRKGQYNKALSCLEELCLGSEQEKKESFPDARMALAWMYQNGRGVKQSAKNALKQYNLGGKEGFEPAKEAYVCLMAVSKKGAEEDVETALEWARELEGFGNQRAAFWIPELEKLLKKIKDEQKQQEKERVTDWKVAFQTALEAEKKGDLEGALYWYQEAAKQGYANAQFNCAIMYHKGEGTAVNEKEALRWYRKAAEQGDLKAQINCGLMYNKGEGTPVNKKEALHWYRKAAEQGNLGAQLSCAMMYEKGEGTEIDEKEALHWYVKAAEQGHMKAQAECAVWYLKGRGTEIDLIQGKAWLKKAAEQGHKGCIEVLKQLEDAEKAHEDDILHLADTAHSEKNILRP